MGMSEFRISNFEFRIRNSSFEILHSKFFIRNSSFEIRNSMNLLIANGRVVDPSQKLDGKLDVLIEDGVIARVDKRIKKNVETIDAEGLIVVPGLIDLHTHLREPGRSE